MADNLLSVPLTFIPQLKPIPMEIWDKYFEDLDDQLLLPGTSFALRFLRKLDDLDQDQDTALSEGWYMVPRVEERPWDMTSVSQPVISLDPFKDVAETATHKAEEYLKALKPKDKMQYDFVVKNGFVQVFTMADDDGNLIFTEDHKGLPESWSVYTCNAGIAVGRFPKNIDINRALKNRNRVHLFHWHEAEITHVTDGSKVKLEVPPIPEPLPDASEKTKMENTIFRDIVYDYMAGNQFVALAPTKEVCEMAEHLSSLFQQLFELMKPEDSEDAPEDIEDTRGIAEGTLGYYEDAPEDTEDIRENAAEARENSEDTPEEDTKGQVQKSATVKSNGKTLPSKPAFTEEQLSEAGIQVTEETLSDVRSNADKEWKEKKQALEKSLKIHCTYEEMANHFKKAAERWGVPIEDLPDVVDYLEKANVPSEVTEGCSLEAKYYVGIVMNILMEAIDSAGARIEEYYRDPEDPLGPTDRGRFKDAVIYLMAAVNCASAEVSAVSYNLKKGTDNIDPESVRRIRSKLTPDIFELIFKEFTKKLRTSPDLKPLFRTMFGFLLYCVDGSDINLPFNKDDEETLCTNGKGRKPYNQIHLNAMYDCLNSFYAACNFRGTKKTGQGERYALYDLLQEFTGGEKAKCLILADRGYEGHEAVARLQKEGVHFLMRVKANNSNGFLSTFKSLKTLGDTFYGEIHYTISKSKMKPLPDGGTAHLVRTAFDFLEEGEVIHVHLRILQFRLPSGELEALITNVPMWQLSPLQLYHIYSRRWSIESSFRSLKYQISVSQQHSWKKEYVRQELWAKLAMFNFVTFITSHTKMPETNRLKPRKHEYKIKTSRAVVLCRNLLVGLISLEEFGSQVVKRLQPIRPDRSYVRNVKPKSAVSFQHRGTGM